MVTDPLSGLSAKDRKLHVLNAQLILYREQLAIYEVVIQDIMRQIEKVQNEME